MYPASCNSSKIDSILLETPTLPVAFDANSSFKRETNSFESFQYWSVCFCNCTDSPLPDGNNLVIISLYLLPSFLICLLFDVKWADVWINIDLYVFKSFLVYTFGAFENIKLQKPCVNGYVVSSKIIVFLTSLISFLSRRTAGGRFLNGAIY